MIVAVADGEEAITNAVDVRQHLQLDVSMTTIRRRLREAGIKCRVPAKKEFLTEAHRASRLEFARRYEDMDLAFWSKVVFADEKTFRSSDHGQLRVWRRDNTRYVSINSKVGGKPSALSSLELCVSSYESRLFRNVK